MTARRPSGSRKPGRKAGEGRGKIPRRRRLHRRRRMLVRMAAGIGAVLFILFLTAGLVGVALYKSGEASLKASASGQVPLLTADPQALEQMQEDYALRTALPWQEDWVVYGDGIYEYKEDSLNFLLLGIDRGGNLEKNTDLSDWNAGQADAIFLVSLDQRDKKVSVIGIPRNSMVEVDIYNGDEQRIDSIYNQICLQYGYAGGGKLGLSSMKACVSELFYQLPIHGVCAVSFDAIGVITDMLGGIEVTVPDDMTGLRADYVQGTQVHLTGESVLPYLRYREYTTLGSPTIRLTRQKEFLREAVRTGMEQVQNSPSLVGEIYKAVIPYMNTDITLDEAVYLGAQALDYRVEDGSFYQLSGADKQVDFLREEGTQDFYDDFYLDEEALRRITMEVFYDRVIWESRDDG